MIVVWLVVAGIVTVVIEPLCWIAIVAAIVIPLGFRASNWVVYVAAAFAALARFVAFVPAEVPDVSNKGLVETANAIQPWINALVIAVIVILISQVARQRQRRKPDVSAE